jgi:surface protein
MPQDCDKPVAGKKLKRRVNVAPEEPKVLYDSADRWTGMNSNLASMDPSSQYQRLKLIQNTVRVDASSYSMNRGALNVYETHPNNVNVVGWNQMSDRTQPHEQVARMSMKSSVSMRPGNMSPGGIGCDIKHNSYDRYLARLKGAGPLRKDNLPIDYGVPITFDPANPIYGGKTVKTSIGTSPCACGRLVGPFINQFAFSFTYTGPAQLPEYFVRYIPILTTDGAMIIYPTVSVVGTTVTMSVECAFLDDEVTNDGFTFNIPGVINFFNSDYVSDLTIITFGSIPLSRDGHQFEGLNVLPNMPITGLSTLKARTELSVDIPTTLANTSFTYCFANVLDFNGMSNQIMQMLNVSIAIDTSFMFYRSAFSPDTFSLNITNVSNLEGMFQETFAFNPSDFTMIIDDTPEEFVRSTMKSGAKATPPKATPPKAPKPIPPKPKKTIVLKSLFKKAVAFATTKFKFTGAIASSMSSRSSLLPRAMLSQVTGVNISSMFYGCTLFNPTNFQFEVAPVAMDYVFFGATAFNKPLPNLVADYVETMDYAFNGASSFNQDLTSWDLISVNSTVNVFSGSQMITDDVPNYFAFSYEFTYTNTDTPFDPLLYLPVYQSGAFNYSTPTITPTINDQETVYRISFRYNYNDDGITNDGITFANTNVVNFYNNNTSGITIINFAGTPFSRAGSQFAGLTVPLVFETVDDPTNVPSILPNTSFNNCFNGVTQFNSNISNWNTSNATNMATMFQGATIFNQNISGWNVQNVIFYDNFSTGSALVNANKPTFSSIPGFIYSFNYTGPDNTVDYANYLPIINTDGCFTITKTTVTPSLSKNITVQMEFVFNQVPSTNDGLSFTNVNSFYNNFTTGLTILKFNNIPLSRGGYQFYNLPIIQISAMDTPTILSNTRLNGFIANSGFNSNINNWAIANLSPDYSYMFWYGYAFNQDISGWNTSGATNMDYMFNGAVAFNKDIGAWNTGAVTSMINTFFNATAFNQDLSGWNVANVAIHTDFAKGSPIEFNNSYLPNFP